MIQAIEPTTVEPPEVVGGPQASPPAVTSEQPEAGEQTPQAPGLPDRGPARALRNLLAHAPRRLARPNGKGLEQFMKQLGVKMDRLTDGEDLQVASLQFDLSYQAVREINRATGSETVAMRLSFSASLSTFAVDGESAVARTFRLSGEAFVGIGDDPQGLFERTFQPGGTAETIATHALDRYAEKLEAEGAEDTPENRREYAEIVSDAVDRAAERIRTRAGDDEAVASRVDDVRTRIRKWLDGFVRDGLEAERHTEDGPLAVLLHHRRMAFEMLYTRSLGLSYSADASVDEGEEDETAAAVDMEL